MEPVIPCGAMCPVISGTDPEWRQEATASVTGMWRFMREPPKPTPSLAPRPQTHEQDETGLAVAGVPSSHLPLTATSVSCVAAYTSTTAPDMRWSLRFSSEPCRRVTPKRGSLGALACLNEPSASRG
jgi:hypothetical protein